MKRHINLLLILILSLSLMVGAATSTAQDEPSGPAFINHQGQDLWLSGINLAWINFGRDLRDFNEVEFIQALDELAAAKGNTLRWWLHTTGSASPIYGEDGKVTGLGEKDTENLRRGLDLAYERGILIMPTLWSHDMMRVAEGIPTEANKLMIEDPEYTQAYIDNALIPLVESVKGHPGIIAWEVFNEPEGVTDAHGWTDERTDMQHIQQFVNLLAGAIHRTDPDVKVTNGSWNMQVLTDVNGMTNYYTDERLIEAGGDPDGTLDFYQVHYYPVYFDESTSPFHNPASYWELDKPLMIGEFPAGGIKNLGDGYAPRKSFQNIVKVYQYIYENGYAGALGWTYNDSENFGSLLDLAPGLLWTANQSPENLIVNVGEIDHLPAIVAPIDTIILPKGETAAAEIVNLTEVFNDQEDGTALTYEITENSAPEKLQIEIQDTGAVTVSFGAEVLGTANIEITATDSGGNYSRVQFVVQITDPNSGNVALGKAATSSTNESDAYSPDLAVDGVENTRWSTEYEDEQWLQVDLDGVFDISQIILKWEAAFGKNYEIQVWNGASWQTVAAEPNSDGQIDEILFDEPIPVRYIRMHGVERGTEWGFSLWEFEVYGVRSEQQEGALTTPPPVEVVVEEAAPVETETALLYDFEGDITGWTLADYWAGGKVLEQSDVMASEGSKALKLTLSTSGTAWEEGGVYLDLPEAADWSAAKTVSADVFVPAEAANFLAQIFVKTGEEWTWANSADAALTPGEWTTVTADLSALGNVADLREIGVKIGSGSTAFEGDAFIDNIVLAE